MPETLTPKFEVPQPDAFTSTPTTQNVDAITQEVQPDSTVKGQMEGLLSEGSQYMDLARQGAKEYANARGLLNSSIAAGAGERAAIESALPIAQQDAGTYNQQSLANQQYENQFAGQTHVADLNRQTSDQDLSRQKDMTAYQTELGELSAEAGNVRQKELMNLESDLKQQLAALQQDFALELETLKSNFDIQGNLDTQMGGLYSDTLKSLAAFLNSPDLTSEQQEAGANTIIANLTAGLEFLSGISGQPTAVNYQAPEGAGA